MLDLTVLVLTYNEHENIERTLSALAWAPRVLIVDSFSDDDTCERARAFPNVEIVQRLFDTHTEQWNFGLAQVTTPWVLTLDADYEVSPALVKEMAEIQSGTDFAGFAARFKLRIFGRVLRSALYPPRTVLFQKQHASYRPDGHTQLLHVTGAIRLLAGVIFHDDRKPLSRWIRSQDRYTKIEARHLISTPNDRLKARDRLRKRIYYAPGVMFFYLLFCRGLILDGWPAWYYVFQRTLAEMLLSLRLITERERLEEDLRGLQ
jgi:glycosyltransferase involved in cell wall biosynthesis